MADDEEAQAQEGEETQGKSGGKLKLIIFIVLGILIIAGASIFATWFFLKDKLADPEAVDVEEIPLEEPVMDVEQGEATYHALQPAFVINYNAAGRARFLQVELSVLTRDPAAIEIMVLHDPLIRNNLLDVFAAQDVMQLFSEEGKISLAESLTETIQEIMVVEMGRPAVESVLFRSFILQ